VIKPSLPIILLFLLIPLPLYAAVPGGECKAAVEEALAVTEKGILHFQESIRALKGAGKTAIAERNRSCLNTVRRALARLYLTGGEYPKALGVLKKYQKVSAPARQDPEINNLIGVAYYYEERYDEARHYFKRALNLDPSLKTALFNMGSINRRLLHLNAARAYQKAKDYEKALDEYANLLWVSPNFVNGRYRLGLLFLQMGRPEDAMREFHRAYNINPSHRQAHLILKSMGDIEAKRGDFIKAVEHYSAALNLKPNYTEAEKELRKYQFEQ